MSTNDNNSDRHINFRDLLRENNADAITPPAFDASTATHKEKVEQWAYYFAKHADEVEEVMVGAEDVLPVHLSWLRDKMPSFTDGLESDDITAGGYIGIGNKTLRTLYIDEHETPQMAYIRFGDNTGMDEIAKEVHAEELQVQEKYGTDAQQQAQKLILDPAFFYKLGKDLEQGFFLPGVNRIR
ncbi:MAG: hypothetical protein IMF19_15650, partial [Proteobacteria bacterium]|nr:hypothetical protein [Pseudomonadota bacterium]